MIDRKRQSGEQDVNEEQQICFCMLFSTEVKFYSALFGLIFFPLCLPLSSPKGICWGCEGDEKSKLHIFNVLPNATEETTAAYLVCNIF